jgi:hypothetical protein
LLLLLWILPKSAESWEVFNNVYRVRLGDGNVTGTATKARLSEGIILRLLLLLLLVITE